MMLLTFNLKLTLTCHHTCPMNGMNNGITYFKNTPFSPATDKLLFYNTIRILMGHKRHFDAESLSICQSPSISGRLRLR
jgi:hypothetical protein